MGADYSFELISIETYAPQFIGHNKFFLGSVYIQSRSMGDICKCRQLFCIVLNSLFPQILPWWLLVVASMVVMVYMEPLGGCRRWGSPEGVEHGGVVGVLPREPRGGSLLLWRRSRSIDGTKIIHLNKKKRRLIDGQSIKFRFFEPKLVEFWKNFVKQAEPYLLCTAKKKLERLQFSNSSLLFKIWSACSCEFKAYFWTYWALYHLLFYLETIKVN